jgi:hypothetical protein
MADGEQLDGAGRDHAHAGQRRVRAGLAQRGPHVAGRLMVQAHESDFRLPYLPVNMEVDTGSLCNLKCRMCHDGVSSRIAADVVHRSWANDQYAP